LLLCRKPQRASGLCEKFTARRNTPASHEAKELPGQESGEAANQTRNETAQCSGDMDDGTEDVSQATSQGVSVFLVV